MPSFPLTGQAIKADNPNPVAKFRIDVIGELARQLVFTPQDTRKAQLTATEDLLLELDPQKAYPLELIIFRITGYRPRRVESSLLTGLALQHDLGLLIEQVSVTLDLHVGASAQPVLTIEELTERFNVTSKTIQRWRRRGLAARRFTFADGKRRVGFLAATVERFLAMHRDQVLGSANFSEVSPPERERILTMARRLAVACRCGAVEISRRISRRLDRSNLIVDHILRDHDLANPAQAILPLAAPAISDEEREQILRGWKRSRSLSELAVRLGRPRSAIYRVIAQERLARLNRRRIRFIDDPLYHQHDARAVMAQIDSQQELPSGQRVEETRVPRDLPPYLQDLYRTPLLSPARERALFLKHNFHKFQFITARRRLDAHHVRGRDLNHLEAFRKRIVETKNQIVPRQPAPGRQRRPQASAPAFP